MHEIQCIEYKTKDTNNTVYIMHCI
jgi:hypothetical protein